MHAKAIHLDFILRAKEALREFKQGSGLIDIFKKITALWGTDRGGRCQGRQGPERQWRRAASINKMC